MQPTGNRFDRPGTGRGTGRNAGQGTEQTWQAPLEADPADAQEQARDLIDDAGDPETPVASAPPDDLDLSRASEADLAEQLYEVDLDDDLDR